MVKVLMLTAYDTDATFYYRLDPFFYIDHPCIKVERKPYQGQIAYSFFENYTHLILERPSGTHDLQVIKLAKQRGLKVICDFDDDILHLDGYNPMFQIYEGAKSTVLECIAEADEVWVSTQGLKRSFALLNKNIQVIPNSHNNFVQDPKYKKPFNKATKKVFWRGGESHLSDVYEKAEQWVELVNRNKDWQFYFVGCRFIFLEQRCGNNYQPVSQMPLMQYFKFMHDHNPNIVFHPLSDTIFNKSKSNISFLESSYCGAAFFGNKDLPEFKHDIIISIDQLSVGMNENFELLADFNVKAWEYIKENLLLSNWNKVREERLLSI